MKSRALSQTQLRIATLVAQGRSNPQVAAALSLSIKTVETHLSHAYRKLGVRGRREVAAALERATPLGRGDRKVEPCAPLSGGPAPSNMDHNEERKGRGRGAARTPTGEGNP